MDNNKIIQALNSIFYDAVCEDVANDDSVLRAAYFDEHDELGGLTASIEDEQLVIYMNTDKRFTVTIKPDGN